MNAFMFVLAAIGALTSTAGFVLNMYMVFYHPPSLYVCITLYRNHTYIINFYKLE